jgi:4,5-dihydroxyphthalate decarboxylase
LLVDAHKAAPPAADGIERFPQGVDAMRNSLELIIQYAVQQRLIPRKFTVDELFSDVTRRLVP